MLLELVIQDHQGGLQFRTIHPPLFPIILSISWLVAHGLQILRHEHLLSFYSKFCEQVCLRTPSDEPEKKVHPPVLSRGSGGKTIRVYFSTTLPSTASMVMSSRRRMLALYHHAGIELQPGARMLFGCICVILELSWLPCIPISRRIWPRVLYICLPLLPGPQFYLLKERWKPAPMHVS